MAAFRAQLAACATTGRIGEVCVFDVEILVSVERVCCVRFHQPTGPHDRAVYAFAPGTVHDPLPGWWPPGSGGGHIPDSVRALGEHWPTHRADRLSRRTDCPESRQNQAASGLRPSRPEAFRSAGTAVNGDRPLGLGIVQEMLVQAHSITNVVLAHLQCDRHHRR
jgi:hypothetical protein